VVDFDARGIEVQTTGLSRETNWWGAFVIGLAGSVLILGLIGYALPALGGTAIILFAVLTSIGVFLCFCLAEMAATWPERAGGLPSYAFESYKPMGDRVAAHVGGFSSWGYWLGWFTVAPINAFLAASYFNDLFDIDYAGTFGPPSDRFGSIVPVDQFITGAVFLLIMFVPCWLGIRLGATFATILGIGTMIPLIFLMIMPVFDPGAFSWSNLDGFGLPSNVTGSFQLIIGWAFIYTWTVLAMEAAACYIGECREPARDAKIALTAEGLFGGLVYIVIPTVVLGVLGITAIQALADDPSTAAVEPYVNGDPALMFNAYVDAIFGTSEFWQWAVGLALITALLLSVLNAVMGASRGLYQNSNDGILPKAFGWVNKHGAPSFAMVVSLIGSLAVLCVGSPLQIFIFSNMGYLIALALSLVGYGIFRSIRNDVERPLRMPLWFGPLALVFGFGFILLWVIGGYYAADYAVGPGYRWLYWIGLILLALYFPLNWWRKMEDRAGGGEAPVSAAESGGSD
jgi:amino acid transporter